MKVFRLGCSRGHDFEGWFASSEEFDRQHAGREIRCPLCEARSVRRLPSAPYVNTGARRQEPASIEAGRAAGAPDEAGPLVALRAYLKAHTEDVGRTFPEVARRMHYGEESRRGIRGRVTSDEAAQLSEEGIEAVVLPPGLVLDDKLH